MLKVYEVNLSLDFVIEKLGFFNKSKIIHKHTDEVKFYIISEPADIEIKEFNRNMVFQELQIIICLGGETVIEFTEVSRKTKEIFPTLDYLLKHFRYDKVCELLSQQGIILIDTIK